MLIKLDAILLHTQSRKQKRKTMKTRTSFNPAMYEGITKDALAIADSRNITDAKGLKKCFDEAIRNAGYSPAYVAKVMRALSPYMDEFSPEDF